MYDPYDPLNDMHLYNMGRDVNQDPDETLKGCLTTGLILLGFAALLVIAVIISNII